MLILPHEQEPKTCPVCGGELERIYAGSVGLVFKGSGFYATDYAKKHTPATSPQKKDSQGKKNKGQKN